jgi:HEAT repeat protein
MNILKIQLNLASPDGQERLLAVAALRQYDAAIAVPLLASRRCDQMVLVRAFVAMGFGHQQNPDAFRFLVSMLETEVTANVRSEVASALIKYGKVAIPPIVRAFHRYPDWLMRMSILLSLSDMDSPQELFQLCLSAWVDPNLVVKETGVQCLASLVGTPLEEDALLHLLAFGQSEKWELRCQTAIALRAFEDSRAVERLSLFQQDDDYRVVSAVLEGGWSGNAIG